MPQQQLNWKTSRYRSRVRRDGACAVSVRYKTKFPRASVSDSKPLLAASPSCSTIALPWRSSCKTFAHYAGCQTPEAIACIARTSAENMICADALVFGLHSRDKTTSCNKARAVLPWWHLIWSFSWAWKSGAFCEEDLQPLHLAAHAQT